MKRSGPCIAAWAYDHSILSTRAFTARVGVRVFAGAQSISRRQRDTSIRSTIAQLEEMPLFGKVTAEAGVFVIIEPEYHYRVFYVVEGQQVFVVRILHGCQRSPAVTLNTWRIL